MKQNLMLGACLLSLSLGYSTDAKSTEFNPQLNGIVLFELENDWAYDSEDSDAEVNTLFTTIEPYLLLSLTDRLAIESNLVLEPLKSSKAKGDDRFLEDHTLSIEELKLSYFGDNYTVFAGKYNPTFGIAWDLAKGIVGKDLAKTYELKERIGLGGSYTVGSKKIGTHTATASFFFLDTTFLSESLFKERTDSELSKGGVSNTEDLSSHSFTLDSENVAGIKGLDTHIGYYNQAEGDADSSSKVNEKGYAAAVTYQFYADDHHKIKMKALLEYADLHNFKGTKDKDEQFITGSLVTKYDKKWNLTIAHTQQTITEPSVSTKDDYQFQISAGRVFKNGISLDVGYRQAEKSDKKTEGIISLLGYTYEF